MIALFTVLRPFLPYIAGVVVALGAVWGVHHHGYTSGVEATEAKYAEATKAAQAKNAELEAKLANATRSLAERASTVTTNQSKVARNEK